MEWNTRASHTSNLQTNNFAVWASDLSHQINATYNFAQANASTPYSGNDQTIKMHSNTNNTVLNQLFLQSTEQSLNYQPILPKTSVSATDFRKPQQLVNRYPVSIAPLSNVTVQMQDGIVLNPQPNSNMHVFTSSAIPGSTVNVLNVPQTPFMAPVTYNNCPPKNSNSVRTSVYPQTNKSSSFSKRRSSQMASYRLKGPPTSQVCATVPPNPASNHNLNSQQNVSCFINPSGQNNQINGPRSSSAIAMKSQQYTSGHVISTPYTVSTHSYRDAIPTSPLVANINPPPPYHAHPVQNSYGHLAQPVANASNENVQSHQNLVLDQNSAEQNMQYYQKPQPVQSARETNEVGSTANYVNEYKVVDKPANESAKPLIPALESKNMQVSTPQATETLVQDESLPNSSGNLGNITKGHLIMDIQNLPDFEKALRQLKDLEIEHKLYIAVVKSKKTSDSAHNKNANVSPSSNNTQNQTFLLPHNAKQVFKAPSQDVVLWESQSSSQNCDVPLSTTKEHLYPILKDLLQGTIDEDMLLNTFNTKEKHPKGHVAVQENGSSSTPLVSGGDKCENIVKNNEETSRTNPKTSPIVPNQEPLKGANNSLGFEQPSRSAMNQSANILTNMYSKHVPRGGLFNHFRLEKNKILAHLSRSVQNPATSNGSSPSTKTVVKECSEKFQCSATTCPELLHQSKSTCLQTPEKNVTTRTSGSGCDASSLPLPVSKATVTTPEAGIVQKLLMTGNSFTMGRTCSLEELKASLPLWVKNLSSLSGLLRDSTESTVSSSSKDDGDKTQQTLENLPNALTQNDQTTAETSSVASSLGNKLDAVSSGLLKGSEPQVAIVAPLVQSKEIVLMEVQKKNLSISLKIDPVIEEGSVRSLKELISTVPDIDRGISSVETGIAVDSRMHQHEAKSVDKNGMVKTETNSSYDCSFLELKKVKSKVSSGDDIDCLNPSSQKCVTSRENDPNLLKPGATAEAELNASMLQISSVCTLVQGDAFYNSQIANIFNTSSVKSSVKNDDPSEEHVPYPQQNKQPFILLKGESETKMTAPAGSILLPSQDSLSKVVAEKPSKDLPGLDMPQKGDTNARNSEEEKRNYRHEDSIISGKKPEQNFSYGGIYRIDLASGDQELYENQDLFSTAVEDGTYAIKNENVKNHILMGENHAQCCTNSESPVTLLNDQLTELLKEYPNGINDLEVQQKSEIKNSVELTEREEETQSCGQNPGPSDAIDQVKHIQSSNKLKNSENDILIDSEDKDGLSSDHISHIDTQQLKHIDDTNATAETTVVKKENETYCCMQAFMASRYAVKPCSCKFAGSVDLKPQKSKNMLELKPKGRESYKTDCRLNNPLQTSVLCPADSVPSGDQSNKFLKNTETDHQVKKSTLSNKERTPSFLEKLDPQKPKRADEQERKVLPISEGSQTWKEETTEMDQIYLRENVCSAQTLPNLGTENFKKVAVQPHSKTESSHKRSDGVVAISKTDRYHHHNFERKRSRKNEKFKIKHDTSETHMIKGPNRLSKGLKRQMTMERKHKVLKIQHSVAKNSTNLGSADFVSNRYKKSWHKSALPSKEHSAKQKWGESQRDLEKNDTIELEHSGPSNSEHALPNKERIERMNLDKYAYSKERENAWKYKRLLLESRRIPKVQKQRGHFSSRLKINSFGKEVVLDAHNRDEWSGRSPEKAASFSKRINKLTLQREQKKSYLNRVSFTETAQESICLKKLEPSPSKPVWRMKSSNVLGNMEVPKTSSSSSLSPSCKNPQMLEFKMCPEILFRTSISEEQATDSKKLPEKDKTPITVDDHIPVDTALKLLDKANPVPGKDSKTTFQTYRKMHLEKRSRSLDSSPIL
ncbi:hypothetical protein lerEdw1_018141 [Lerista edwardsae]|nr:hypothetical protein lerEdw1_018141 [Lerista edwardsae]